MVYLGTLAWLLAACCCCCCLAVPAVTSLQGLDAALDSNSIEDPERQLSPATQSFLGALGTALGPIVGAIIGPLLTNVGQNLSAGSGAQAIAQLQEAVGANASTGAPPSPAPVPASQRPARPNPKPTRPSKPSRRPGTAGRPPRPVTTPTRPPAPGQSYNAVVLDVPGHGPFLFLMAANLSASAQATAIQQAQAHATQFLSGRPRPSQGQYPQQGAQATKPSSAGELPPRPSSPLDEIEDGDEEVAAFETRGPIMPHAGSTESVKGAEERVPFPPYQEEDSLNLFPELTTS